MSSKRIRIKGIVQGVGFRPFVYRLADVLKIRGFVRNTTNGVEIEVEGKGSNLKKFIGLLEKKKPVAARIDKLLVEELPARGFRNFIIKESRIVKGFTQVSPDIATCRECLKEFVNLKDRRYRFPFINCTNCGPRYSIIIDTPYDRKRTTMNDFVMCERCELEFYKITNRRFHAQPDCCSICGPLFSLYKINGKKIETEGSIEETVRLLKKGEIVAIKGIGGFHIACDATNCQSVKRLRRLKNRPTKPFAIMIEKENLKKIVYVSLEERKLIESPVAPIMLLKKRRSVICEEVAPNNPYLGVMLPYTPVHYLLLEEIPHLVMTSGNIQDEPIVKDDQEVKEKLAKIVNYYLTHNRNIENRCDDSIGFYTPKKDFSIIRRSRGYVPAPLDLPFTVEPTLAVGPYLKNTFTLAHRKEAYISPHIGDLDNFETLNFFNEMVKKYKRWFKIEPKLIVHDLHPDYLSTKIALDMAKGERLKVKGVQHHIAHIVSCLGEHKIFDKAIGIAFDGTGYGLDGRIWGSEFFIGDLNGQKRAAHLEYLPLPGGEASIKKPYRIAIAYIHKLLGDRFLSDVVAQLMVHRSLSVVAPFMVPALEIETIKKIIDANYNLAYTSSMGRLFDCVSAMLGITKEITYEAEAAINLEYIAKKGINGHYPYKIEGGEEIIIYVSDILQGIIQDLKKNVSKDIISAKFHNTVVQFSLDIAKKLRKIYKVNKVCLSGGVFQNRYLLNLMIRKLESTGFKIYIHHKLPTNDGCISYGQVIYGNLIT